MLLPMVSLTVMVELPAPIAFTLNLDAGELWVIVATPGFWLVAVHELVPGSVTVIVIV